MADASLMPPLNTLARGTAITVDPFAITTSGPIIATAGVFYTQTLQAPGCGSPCTWSPASFGGLSLNSSGVLSGTPFNQTGTFTATATGPNGSVAKLFAVFISSPSTALASGFGTFADQTVGNFLTNQVLPFGGTPPYTVSLVSGTLPPGISLQPGAGLCTTACAEGMTYLAGRAMQAGVFTFTLQFQDSAANTFTPAPYTWRISPLSNQYFTLPLTGTISVGVPYPQALLATGGSGSYTFTLVNTLPPGLSLNSSTGVVNGTPTQSGNVNVQILITDNADASVRFTAFINVNVSGPPTVRTLPATFVTNTSARLNGTVNAAGFARPATSSGARRSHMATPPGASARPASTPRTSVPTSTSPASPAACITIVSSRRNSQGARQGDDQVFTCSPQVFTFNAFNISAFSATLDGGGESQRPGDDGQLPVGPHDRLRKRDARAVGRGRHESGEHRRGRASPASRAAPSTTTARWPATPTARRLATTSRSRRTPARRACSPASRPSSADDRDAARRGESERPADERALRVGRDDGLRQHHSGSGDGLGPRAAADGGRADHRTRLQHDVSLPHGRA